MAKDVHSAPDLDAFVDVELGWGTVIHMPVPKKRLPSVARLVRQPWGCACKWDRGRPSRVRGPAQTRLADQPCHTARCLARPARPPASDARTAGLVALLPSKTALSYLSTEMDRGSSVQSDFA